MSLNFHTIPFKQMFIKKTHSVAKAQTNDENPINNTTIFLIITILNFKTMLYYFLRLKFLFHQAYKDSQYVLHSAPPLCHA